MADEMKNEATEKPHPFQAEADAANASRSGVGTRVFVGFTRGKGSIPIKWEKFDESKADTLPKSLKEFSEVTKVTDPNELLEYLIVGYNDAQYTAASDPIAEHVNPAWDKDTQAQFRLVVRNYSKAVGVSIEDAVALVKPGVEKAFAAKSAK